jgi:hypothetical protein
MTNDRLEYEVKKLSVNPGDIVVLKVNIHLDEKMAAQFKQEVLDAVGSDVKVLILDKSAQLGVIQIMSME